MDTLQITLFGHVTVIHPNGLTPLKLPRSIQSFLAYLLLQPHLVSRDMLMEVFWVDTPPDRARSSLTTAIWRLRQLIEPHGVPSGTYLITTNTSEVGFNWDCRHWLDTESFEQHVHPFLRKPLSTLGEDDVKHAEEILALYRGELLEGLYEDWALRERERFRSLYLNCLTHLMEHYTRRNDFAQSITYGQEILRHDQLREDIHRDLMRIYLEYGQRNMAARQYIQCRELLNRELGVPPLEETELLYQQIVTSTPACSSTNREALSQEITQLLHEFQLVKRSFDETGRALARIAQSVNRFMGEAALRNPSK